MGPGGPGRLARPVRRGEVCVVNLSPSFGTEMRDPHPCLIVQSDLLEHDLRPRTIVVPFTSKCPGVRSPT
ncbi:MAG: type II toxin-antitoxin system PemK/MazF family toxin [Candidatus Eremiobacterota bacterium]